MNDLALLTGQVEALRGDVDALRVAVDRRTRTRTVVTLAVTAALAIAFCLAAVTVVHTEVARHADSDHGRWCAVYRLVAEISGIEQSHGMDAAKTLASARRESAQMNCP